ncbi:Uncharacterised protein [Vibrio cholerae]|uniref:Uncharacterized protein n=1 Tax=Vibrio cholerae TaxID=666 RepID=A0A656AN87_VIBCL|nr:Uncharacterised protein [Vibrio cholerae]CSA08479.1 Uncharacterised protein [Vibrio cholerae]CSA21275.1 Uncharacterised protein [Vibrio cholerae]CSA30559.1 Uncharacterised protein [Vibrio cholerae]CSA60231.1 Uncharacterised protein [Vibrio cholerae]
MANLRHNLFDRHVVGLHRVNHVEAVAFLFVFRTNTHLHRMLSRDQTFFWRMVEHGAVVIRTAVRVSVRVCIKVDQRHFTEVLSVSTQDWQSDEVIATQCQHGFATFQDFAGRGF